MRAKENIKKLFRKDWTPVLWTCFRPPNCILIHRGVTLVCEDGRPLVRKLRHSPASVSLFKRSKCSRYHNARTRLSVPLGEASCTPPGGPHTLQAPGLTATQQLLGCV